MKDESLPQQVLWDLESYGWISAGDTVCCALSGGADSVCLLRCLLELRQTLGIQVSAVHVNHQIRGAESDGDEQFCRELCRAQGVPLAVYTFDVPKLAQERKQSLELAARDCRYQAFEQELERASWIATAHTASDNLETMLHRLVRGCSLHGMTAIPPRNGRVIRPLLQVTREQAEAYLAQLGQSYVTDSTNASDLYTRNRIRHQIVPVLKQLNPSIEQTVSRELRALRRDDALLTARAEALYRSCHISRNVLLRTGGIQTESDWMRCLAMLLQEHGVPCYGELLEHLLVLAENGGGRCSLNDHLYAEANEDCLRLVYLPPHHSESKAPVPLHLGRNRLYAGYSLDAMLLSVKNFGEIENVHRKFANNCFDYDKIKGSICLCPRKYGDRMQRAGRTFTSSLKKLIQECVPSERRSTLHTIADDAGTIYAEYIGIAERVRPDETTRRLLVVRVIPETGGDA